MKLTALITTWLGLAGIALLGWLIPWVSTQDGDGPITTAAEAVRDEPDRAGLGAIPGFYATHAWLYLLLLMAALGLFAMFTSRRDRWVAVLGNLAGAALLSTAAFGVLGSAVEDGVRDSIGVVGAVIGLVIMLVMAVFSACRAAFIGALPTALVALVGLAWSVWLVLGSPQSEQLSVSWLGWLLPTSHFLVLVGALVSVAVAGRNKSDEPAVPGTSDRDALPGATPASSGF